MSNFAHKNLANQVNEAEKAYEKSKKLIELQEKLNLDDLLIPGRQILREGTWTIAVNLAYYFSLGDVVVLNHNKNFGNIKQQPFRIYLFNDIIILKSTEGL